MLEIVRAKPGDAKLLSGLAKETFLAAHRESAPLKDLEAYLARRLSIESVEADLLDEKNLFHLAFYDGEPAGFSKLNPNCQNPKIESTTVCCLDKLYLRADFHDKGVGRQLLRFNIELSKTRKQTGMWLLVWMGNARAIRFYQRAGFKAVGETGFQISETHSNPNYWMSLAY